MECSQGQCLENGPWVVLLVIAACSVGCILGRLSSNWLILESGPFLFIIATAMEHDCHQGIWGECL